jgi:hypothetical protein
MADSESTLKLYGTAMYGSFSVLVGDILRPLISEGALTSSPHNLTIVKKGNYAWIIDPTKTHSDPDWILCYCTKESDDLYHLHDPSKLRHYRSPVSVSYALIEPSPALQPKGNRQLSHNQSYGNLNPLEVLHVILGHISESTIKRIVRNNLVDGLKFSYDQIKHLKLGLCPTCMMTKMKAFPIYPTMSIISYGIFECLSFDIIEFGQQTVSIDGYRYVALYVDSCTHKLMVYGMKRKDELLNTLKLIIHQYGSYRNSNSMRLTYLNCDSGSEQLETSFLTYCRTNHIYVQASAPYKHQQNFIECFVGAIKNGVRVALLYNKAPFYLWYHAIVYYIHTYNQTPRRNDTRSKDECFYGKKSDVSTAVPFYANGFAHRPKEIRKDKVYSQRAEQCRFIGYADDVNWTNSPQISSYDESNSVSYKDSYIVLMKDGKRLIRHDVIFELYQNQPTILKAEPADRDPSDPKQDSNYSSEEYLDDFDRQLSQPIRDPHSIFSNSALQRESNSSKLTSSQTENSSTVPTSDTFVSEQPPHLRSKSKVTEVVPMSKRNLRPTEKYVNYRYDILKHRSHPSTSQITANINAMIDDPEKVKTFNPAFNTPKSLLIPLTLEEALSGPDAKHWHEAWQKEMNKVSDRKTWELSTDDEILAMLTKALKSKFTFRLTCLIDGSWKYKVRLVACGYSQIAGHDYNETFAPTAKFKSICIVLNLAAIHDWEIYGLDIENAFLESDLDETIYMNLPLDVYSHSDGKPVVVKLKKSLYGLKQAGELFYKLMRKILTSEELNMTCCIHDMCVFTLYDEETHERVIAVTWVDDIIVAGNSTTIVNRIIDHVESKVTKMQNLGEITRYIGIDMVRDRINHTLELTQVPFTKAVIEKLGPNLKSTNVPLNPYHDYRAKNEGTVNPPLHAELGSLRYLADRTKPTLQTALSLLQTGALNPTQVQVDGVKHVIRYLTGTVSDGITFARGLESEPLVELFGMCDASYIPAYDSKGQLAFALFLNLNSGAVEAKSCKDSTVSTSATHVELKAMYLLVLAVIWARGFLAELGFEQLTPTTIWTDSASALLLATTFQLSSKSQHLTMRINAIHQEVSNKVIVIKYIDTDGNRCRRTNESPTC